jgi:peptidoglycan/LPS O-acetylase OafA/YrhL
MTTQNRVRPDETRPAAPRSNGAPAAAPRFNGSPAPRSNGAPAAAPRFNGSPAPRSNGAPAAAPRFNGSPAPRSNGAPAAAPRSNAAPAPRSNGAPAAAPRFAAFLAGRGSRRLARRSPQVPHSLAPPSWQAPRFNGSPAAPRPHPVAPAAAPQPHPAAPRFNGSPAAPQPHPAAPAAAHRFNGSPAAPQPHPAAPAAPHRFNGSPAAPQPHPAAPAAAHRFNGSPAAPQPHPAAPAAAPRFNGSPAAPRFNGSPAAPQPHPAAPPAAPPLRQADRPHPAAPVLLADRPHPAAPVLLADRPHPAPPLRQADRPHPAAPPRLADRKATEAAPGAGREHFNFIGGLRALAAAQVVTVHYFAAFLPVAVRGFGVQHYAGEKAFAHSPLFILVDGWLGLYVFFLMSGFVLGQSFTKTRLNPGQQIVKRYLRLWLPAASAVAVGAGLLSLMPHAGAQAAAISQSPWGEAFYRSPLSWAGVVKDGFFDCVLLGYRGTSIFSHLGGLTRGLAIPPLTAAVDSPLWALHVEFWGSMVLVALAAAYRHVRRGGFWAFFAVGLLVVGTSWAGMILLGFAAYTSRERLVRSTSGLASACGLGCIVAGIYSATASAPRWATVALRAVSHVTLLHAPDPFEFQSFVAAGLVFLGVLLAAPVRRWLGCRLMDWLGTLTYSFYLLHFPILFTVGSVVFAALAPYGYGFAVGVALVVGSAVTLGSAVVFERFVDRPGAALAGRIASALRTNPPAERSRRTWVPGEKHQSWLRA